MQKSLSADNSYLSRLSSLFHASGIKAQKYIIQKVNLLALF